MTKQEAVEYLNKLRERQAAHEAALIEKDDCRIEIGAINSAIQDYEDQIGRIHRHIRDLKIQAAGFRERFEAVIVPDGVTPAEMEAAERMAHE